MKTFKQYLTESNITYYHASQLDNLDEIGISPDANPHVSVGKQGYVYLGPIEYMDEYLSYAREGKYYIYEVNVEGLNLDNRLPAGQVRTRDFVNPERVKLVDKRYSKPDIHPREQEYLKWMKEIGKQ